jgi:hypothetical protein
VREQHGAGASLLIPPHLPRDADPVLQQEFGEASSRTDAVGQLFRAAGPSAALACPWHWTPLSSLAVRGSGST